jgi:hypothetical protein
MAALMQLDQKPLYRRLDRVLGRLRKTLQEQGIEGLEGLEP